MTPDEPRPDGQELDAQGSDAQRLNGVGVARALDEQRMEQALAEARLAAEAGEVPVGAVLYFGDRPISTGQNRVLRDHDPTAHAEVVAMRRAGQLLANYRLLDCTLYCTLEPCAMCAGAMIHARLGRLVYGARDPKAGAAGSVLAVLNHPELNHKLIVESGVLAPLCGAELRAFFQARRASRTSETADGPSA